MKLLFLIGVCFLGFTWGGKCGDRPGDRCILTSYTCTESPDLCDGADSKCCVAVTGQCTQPGQRCGPVQDCQTQNESIMADFQCQNAPSSQVCCQADPCKSFPCQNEGVCSITSSSSGVGYNCTCAAGFQGRNCEERLYGKCGDVSGERCLPSIYVCTESDNRCESTAQKCCAPPKDICFNTRIAGGVLTEYPGRWCRNATACNTTDHTVLADLSCSESDTICCQLDPCKSNPCLHEATCSIIEQDGTTTFECNCTGDYLGKRCEKRPEWIGNTCSSDADCDRPGGACYKGTCLCSTSLVYQVSSQSCVQACPSSSLTDSYLKYSGSRIYKRKLAKMLNTTLEACQEACSKNPGCQSLSMRPWSSPTKCLLHNVTIHEAGHTWKDKAGWNLYQRNCGGLVMD